MRYLALFPYAVEKQAAARPLKSWRHVVKRSVFSEAVMIAVAMSFGKVCVTFTDIFLGIYWNGEEMCYRRL